MKRPPHFQWARKSCSYLVEKVWAKREIGTFDHHHPAIGQHDEPVGCVDGTVSKVHVVRRRSESDRSRFANSTLILTARALRISAVAVAVVAFGFDARMRNDIPEYLIDLDLPFNRRAA
jgi:hypothetical protein